MGRSVQRFFAAVPESVALAREFVASALTSWGLVWLVEDIRLCVSELASNALLHGTEPGRGFLVRLDREEDFVRVEVHDSLGSRPEVKCPADSETSGRGLLVVGELADGWGVEDRRPFGKVVWVRFKRS